jgi:DNA-directed RNA polymerase beta' subunit
MNETEDSNKKIEKQYEKNETTPRYIGYDENKLQEMKTIESK